MGGERGKFAAIAYLIKNSASSEKNFWQKIKQKILVDKKARYTSIQNLGAQSTLDYVEETW